MLTNKNGFTMLEMIIVLIVVMSVMFVTIVNIGHFHTANQVNQVAKMIVSKYELAQSLALTYNERCSVSLTPPAIKITCGEEEKVSPYNANIIINSNFNQDTIKITKKGYIERGGSINVKLKNATKTIRIGIGKGDVRIE